MSAPERIYLQDAGDYAGAAEFEVTWCVEPQDPADTEYIRADLIPAAALAVPEVRALVEALQRIGRCTFVDAFNRERPSYEATLALAALRQIGGVA